LIAFDAASATLPQVLYVSTDHLIIFSRGPSFKMVNACAPINLVLQAVHTGKEARANSKAKKSFFDALPPLLQRQVAIGNLEVLQSPPGKGAAQNDTPSGWAMTDNGTQAVLNVYEDIRLAINYFRLPPESRAVIGLSNKVVVQANKGGSPRDIRKRVGTRWDPGLKERVLKGKNSNPFIYWPGDVPLERYRRALGVLWRVTRSEGYVDVFLARLLGLAQLCGIDRVSFTELQDLTMHATYYERLARNYLALVLNIDTSMITNLAFGNVFQGQPLGSTQNVPEHFPKLAPSFRGAMVQIGTVQSGQVHVTYPTTLDRMNQVAFHLRAPKDSPAQDGEPVWMLSGWAACLVLRPPRPAGGQPSAFRAVRHDVHGSPLYTDGAPMDFEAHVKRLSDGRLVAKPTWKQDHVTGRGVFGRACACAAAAAGRRVDVAARAAVGGVPVLCYQQLPWEELQGWNSLTVVWDSGDMVAQVRLPEAYNSSVYVQAYHECMYCAISRAIGAGCAYLIAGGGVPPTG
jgi:hypothetical protein